MDALVCSPYEVGAVRKIFKKIITLDDWKKNFDQKRSMEAKKSIRLVSDWKAITASGNIKKYSKSCKTIKIMKIFVV